MLFLACTLREHSRGIGVRYASYTMFSSLVCGPRKYKEQVGYSAVNHESLYNYFIPRHRTFRRESLTRDAFMGMLGGIPPNTQRLSCILIGCIFYSVV